MLLVAAAAILAGVVLAALGRAGEMATFAGDTAPIELDEVSATDVALLRPPMSLWGYNAQATEDALRVIARSVTARDVEIATLRRELADLQGRQDGARAVGIGDRPTAPAGPPVPASPAGPVRSAGPVSPGGPVRPAAPASGARPPGGASPARAASPAGPPAGQPRRADLPAGQPRRADPPAPPADEEYRAGPPWLPAWQRPSGPGTDE
ncbi:MAG TPA: hypothetical protein VLL69_10335, partial [Streptosporangiaceae bacterium]|nr:hypothetical protein [Streptosporangiaceae bacterium]